MKSFFYRNKWSQLKKGPGAHTELRRLSRQIAYSFMDAYLKDCHYESDYIDLLCEMTTCWDDPERSGIAAQSLFGIIIESLCDDFEELQTDTYNRVMAQVITYCRELPAGNSLNQTLKQFGLNSRQDILNRISSIRSDGRCLPQPQRISKILLMSRVTIGADVAITSVIIQRLAELYPAAQMVLIGGSKLDEVYGGNPDLTLRRIDYNRRGGLLDRLYSWHTVLEIIRKETAGLTSGETILIDPDSRLSQLGVLPLISPEQYYFFDSRSDESLNSRLSMSELTNEWLNRLTGSQKVTFPNIWLLSEHLEKALRFCNSLKSTGAKKIIAVNFGVGGNPRKKMGKLFEHDLLNTLLQEPQTVVILDKGYGEEELRYADALMDSVKAKGCPVKHTSFHRENDPGISHGVIGLQTSIGEIAAIISHCDEYIGYDSACQHIAAAAGTPCLTIFAGSNNMRFIRRWSAFGCNRRRMVHVDTLNNPTAIDIDDIIIRIMNERRT